MKKFVLLLLAIESFTDGIAIEPQLGRMEAGTGNSLTFNAYAETENRPVTVVPGQNESPYTSVAANPGQMDVTGLPEGIYFVEIKSGNKLTLNKLVIKQF